MKNTKISSIIKLCFAASVILYLSYCTYDFLRIDACLDDGLVWDYEQHICRNDCWKITDGFGCIKMTDEQVKLFEDCRYKGADCIPDSVYDEICKNNDLPINKITGECDTEFSPKKCSEYTSDWHLPKICE